MNIRFGNTSVCVFAKPPVPGRVKTRLASAIGPEAAAQLAAAMLSDVWSVLQATPGITPILAAAEEGAFPFEANPIWRQKPGALDCRIESILARALRNAPAAIALAADTPTLTPLHLTRALAALAGNDAVLGPCDDGGFYLLGLKRCPRGLLESIPWSCAATCRETEDRLIARGLTVATLASLPDIDTIDDLPHLQQAGPACRAWYASRLWLASSSPR